MNKDSAYTTVENEKHSSEKRPYVAPIVTRPADQDIPKGPTSGFEDGFGSGTNS